MTNKISKNHHNISEYSQPYQSLGKYKVLNILSGQVMLVLCSETQQSYAMKVNIDFKLYYFIENYSNINFF